MKHRTAITTLSALAFACTTGLLLAGPLSPPAGPVAPTGKTTQEIYDKAAAAETRVAINAANTPGDADSTFRITSTGSYYLTASVIVLPGKRGIEIAADDVTIDLNGYRIGGYPGALQGIKCVGNARRGITIRNGSIWTMDSEGIDFRSDGVEATKGCRLERITVQDCSGVGVFGAYECVFEHVQSSGNGGAGFMIHQDAVLRDCVACRNTGFGIWIGSGTVESCVANNNSGEGINAIAAAVSHCFAKGNTGYGIICGDGSVIDCTALANSAGGIRGAGECLIRSNTCSANMNASHTAAGVICDLGGRVRAEGNTCVNNGIGIEAVGTRHFIVRNTCSGNQTNWEIAAGNFYGPIIDRTAVTPAAVSGNYASSSLGSTDSNANFTY